MGTYAGMFGFSIIFIQQIVRGWIYVTISKRINAAIESRERATLLSFCTMSGSLLYAVILPVLGYTADSLSVSTTLLICGMAILCIVAGVLLKRRRFRAVRLDS